MENRCSICGRLMDRFWRLEEDQVCRRCKAQVGEERLSESEKPECLIPRYGLRERQMIDLMKFCSKSNDRVNINEPFSKGKWTYATNAHICVRIPRLHVPQFPERKDAPDCEKIFREAEEGGPYEWVDVPEVGISTVECDVCDGTGKWSETGLPDIACEDCEGTGKLQQIKPIAFRLGDAMIWLSDVYLDLIRKELPHPEIGLTEKAATIGKVTHHNIKPVKIRFDGGTGLLMSMFE